jgi:hypothetical protein
MLLFHFQLYDYIHGYNDFNVYMVKFHRPLTVQFASIMVLMTDSIQK